MNTPVQTEFAIRAVHAISQQYDVVPPELVEGAGSDAGGVGFIWDWKILDSRRVGVVLGAQHLPSPARPEIVRYGVLGVVEFHSPPGSPGLEELVRVNIPAILFPYVREGLASLSGRGPNGPFRLDPINVVALSESFDASAATGLKDAAENPEWAEWFGIRVVARREDPEAPPGGE